MYMPANYKRTFYNNLRVYENSPNPLKNARTMQSNSSNQRSRTQIKLKDDVFLRSQMHFNSKYVKEAKHVRNYQKAMDYRLSMPKNMNQSPRNPAKNTRVSQMDPVITIKERENSGERVDLSYYKKYTAPIPK